MKPKGRPKKYKIIHKSPKISHFSPRGQPGRPDETELKLEEFEAIRLADFEGISQTQAAKQMNISQQTFSRLLRRAHKAISEGLVYGKIIRIQGGSYIMKNSRATEQTAAEKS